MLDVDVLGVWRCGKMAFAAWFAATGLIGNCLFARLATRLTLARAIAAGLLITGLSWLLVIVVPVPLGTYVAVWREFLGRSSDSQTWVVAPLLSGIVGALCGLAVLAVFKHRMTLLQFGSLLAVNLACVFVAAWRMWAYVDAHPPVALLILPW